MPEIYHSLVQVFSLFPKPILKIMSGWNMGTSIGVTNLAGPTDCVFVGGQRVSYKYGYCGLLWRHASKFTYLLFTECDYTSNCYCHFMMT